MYTSLPEVQRSSEFWLRNLKFVSRLQSIRSGARDREMTAQAKDDSRRGSPERKERDLKRDGRGYVQGQHMFLGKLYRRFACLALRVPTVVEIV